MVSDAIELMHDLGISYANLQMLKKCARSQEEKIKKLVCYIVIVVAFVIA